MSEVTIVIPVFNRAEYLPQLFRSLDALTYPHVSLLFVDNGSTDESLTLCKEYADRTSLSVNVLQESHKGANAARNCGLRHCTSEWVYFFDSDDDISPDFLDVVMPCAGESDIVFFPTGQEVSGRHMIRDYKVTDSVAFQILSGMFNTQSIVWRTHYLRKIGGWNETLSVWQDWELGVRMLVNRPSISWFTERAFHCIHVHNDSITGSSFSENVDGRLRAIQTVANQVGGDLSARKAVYLRTMILEGLLCREGVDKDLWLQISTFTVSSVIRILGTILRKYVSIGGRGAWRIASKACSC